MPRLPAVPKPQLASNWRDVLRHAWSVRFMAVAAILSFLEVVLQLCGSGLPFPPLVIAALTGFVSAGAFVTRLLAQKQFPGDDK